MSAGKLQRNANGKSVRNPATGKLIRNTATNTKCGCNCEGSAYDCLKCYSCCFSTLSTIKYSFASSSVSFQYGDISDFPASFEVEAPLRDYYPLGATYWYIDRDVGNYPFVQPEQIHGAAKPCDGPLAWVGGAYFPLVIDEFGVVTKYVEFSVGGGGSPGDCCGVDTTVSYSAFKYERERYYDDEAEEYKYTEFEEPTAVASGAGEFKVQVFNNNCCASGLLTCAKTAGDCDGSCVEELP